MKIERELLEQELGRRILKLLENADLFPQLAVSAENSAAKLLGQLQRILNDPALDDFECVDAIVSAFHAAGISTTRHDF